MLLSTFSILIAATFLFFSRKTRLPGYSAFATVIIFVMKCFCGFALVYIYSEIYRERANADVFKLFDDSRILFDVYEKNKNDFFQLMLGLDSSSPYFDIYTQKMANWNKGYSSGLSILNDNRTLIRLNALIMFVSRGVYSFHVIIFCFISTLGFVKIFKAFYPILKSKKRWLFAAVFLIPSVIFWSSGLLKEALLFFLIGSLISLIIQDNPFSKLKHYFSFIAIFIGFLMLKVYILFAFVPGIIGWLLAKKFLKISIPILYISIILILFILVWLISTFVPALDVIGHLSFIQKSMLRLAFYNDSGSLVYMQPLEPELWSFLRNLPEALLNAAFRPGILDAQNSLQWLAAFENAFIVICTILCVALFKRPDSRYQENVVWFCFSFVFILYAIMGLSTPILGALVRYRMPALPFMFIGMLLITDTQRLKKIIFELFNYEPGNHHHNRSQFRHR